MSTYKVNYTTEYSDGTTEQHTSKPFDNFEKAAAYAAEISRTHKDDDGVFRSEWLHNYASSFIENAPSQLRITAHIEKVE